MTSKEIEELISKIPEVDALPFANPIHMLRRDRYCYIVYKKGLDTKEYLSSTGEIILGTARTSSIPGLVSYLQDGYMYLGMGILHKKI